MYEKSIDICVKERKGNFKGSSELSVLSWIAHQNKRSFIDPLKIGYCEYPFFIIKN